ncbi:E3 ubiquitin-protein ligase DMA1 [Diplodia seriata]|uniref:RING-type E3 ubiquitin transferase n=2 Tax=Diplodia seriata TaxID=420778 RepID=A0A1S8B859_9PEZI|nr:E3 ubiquitin-protein ligase DMA1 [Diplodia seriata]
MFTTPAPSAPTLSTTTSPASPTSPTRSGRLRGLSYLRSYTHLHSSSDRSSAGSSGHIRRPSLVRTRSTPSANASLSSSSTDTAPSADLPTNARHAPVNGAADTPGATSGWVPTVVGRSGLSRVASSAEPSTTSATSPRPASMTRTRAESAAPSLGVSHHGPSSGDATAETSTPHKQLPSIRFIPHEDPRASRPSLQFPPISRTLPSEDCVIRVGRYSEKDNIPNDLPPHLPSSAPVGFKSKVVSRRHCEFWCKDGQWWIKDVKSSSGTFLNHIRLSQPGVESKPYKVGDGDVVQLGIDFRGGEEMIFRCVKIRIECNRNWQKALNNFNKSTHKRLRNLAQGVKSKDSDSASTHSTDCSICLMSIRPCQALFVAPCSHVWHYKCIARIINGPTYPQFMCPNCRMVNDLEADVSEPEDWDDELDEELEDQIEEKLATASIPIASGTPRTLETEADGTTTPRATPLILGGINNGSELIGTSMGDARIEEEDLAAGMVGVSLSGDIGPPSDQEQLSDTGLHTPPDEDALAESIASPSANVQPVPITAAGPGPSSTGTPLGESGTLPAPAPSDQYALSPTPPVPGPECPMTPRNNAGPFVLDGAGGSSRRGSSEDALTDSVENRVSNNSSSTDVA